MLPLPEKGINRSVTAHNSKLAVAADWVETTLLLDEEEVTAPDVADYFVESNIYSDQDFCNEFLTSVWAELRRRDRLLGLASTMDLHDRRLERRTEWTDAPAQALCLLVSLAPQYTAWHKNFGSDYTEQGALFEAVCLSALEWRFPDWEVTPTGWASDTTVDLATVVPHLAGALDEDHGDLDKWASGKAHEAGLDVAWHLRFRDGRGGYPVFLGQCASGENWKTKLHTPELSVWRMLIESSYPPTKAFLLPFALGDDAFTRRRLQVAGLLLDRHRLLPPEPEAEWLADTLQDRLREWLHPRTEWLLSGAVSPT